MHERKNVRERKGEEDKKSKKKKGIKRVCLHLCMRKTDKKERGREGKKAEDKRGNNGERKDVESILTCVCICMRKK